MLVFSEHRTPVYDIYLDQCIRHYPRDYVAPVGKYPYGESRSLRKSRGGKCGVRSTKVGSWSERYGAALACSSTEGGGHFSMGISLISTYSMHCEEIERD